MRNCLGRIGWIGAIAAFAMMLSVRTFHSPLQHYCSEHECHGQGERHHGVSSTTTPPRAAKTRHSCGHHDHCHDHHHKSEVAQSHVNDGSRPDEEKVPIKDCSLCELLSVPVDIVALSSLSSFFETVTSVPDGSERRPKTWRVQLPDVRGPPTA